MKAARCDNPRGRLFVWRHLSRAMLDRPTQAL